MLNVDIRFFGAKFRIKAERGTHAKGGWLLEKVIETPKGEAPREMETWFWKTTLEPGDLMRNGLDKSDAYTIQMLLDAVREHPKNTYYRMWLYGRLVYPLQGILLLLVAVPVILSRESVRKSRLFGAGISAIFGGVYYLTVIICTWLGENDKLPPMIAAWLPVALFGLIGLYLFDNVAT
jgi:lipopolysaccharide export system permease protein